MVSFNMDGSPKGDDDWLELLLCQHEELNKLFRQVIEFIQQRLTVIQRLVLIESNGDVAGDFMEGAVQACYPRMRLSSECCN